MKVRIEADPHLPPVWFIGWNKACRVAVMIDREDVKTVRGSVAAVGRRYAAPVERPAAPRARNRRQHMMVMGRGPRKTVLLAEVVMFRRVGMPGETYRITAAEERQEFGPVCGIERRVVRIEIVSQRNVHDRHDEARAWSLPQRIGGKSELPFAENASVFTRAARFGRVGAEILDVVQHEKKRIAIFEGIIIGPEHTLERLAAVARIGCLEVQIMVAANIPPGKPDLPDDPVVPAIERKIVEHYVSPVVIPKAASAPTRPLTTSSRMKSISAWLSGCGSAKSTASKRLGSVALISPKSTDAGKGPVGARPG